jgi:hypothetical protein
MPRKQRFKPSRKPKPVPVNEDAALGHQDRTSLVSNEKSPMRDSLPPPDVEAIAEEGTLSS